MLQHVKTHDRNTSLLHSNRCYAISSHSKQWTYMETLLKSSTKVKVIIKPYVKVKIPVDCIISSSPRFSSSILILIIFPCVFLCFLFIPCSLLTLPPPLFACLTSSLFPGPDDPIFGARGSDAPASNFHVVIHLVFGVILPDDQGSNCSQPQKNTTKHHKTGGESFFFNVGRFLDLKMI